MVRLALLLRLVPGDDLVARELERTAQRRRDPLERGRHLARVDARVGDVDAVEARGQLAYRHRAAEAHVGDDLGDRDADVGARYLSGAREPRGGRR